MVGVEHGTFEVGILNMLTFRLDCVQFDDVGALSGR